MTTETTPLSLRRENGKCITVAPYGTHQVSLILWRKNQSPEKALILDSDEARELALMLKAAAGT